MLKTAFLVAVNSGAALGSEPEATAFVMRNHEPFTAIIGIPTRWPDGTSHMGEVVWNVSNHSASEASSGSEILKDGETSTLTARFQYPISQRIQVGVELPWISHSGGMLDGLIDQWHGWFNMREGIRPLLPDNELSHVIRIDGTDTYRLDDSASGIGDMRLAMAMELGNLERLTDDDTGRFSDYLARVPWRLSLTAKLPTGDIEKLTGSGNTDIAAGLGWRSPRARGTKLNWWLDLGLVWPGDVDIDTLDTAGQIFFYDAALAWRILRRLDVIAQVAGHSAAYQGDIALLSRPGAQLAIGGVWHITPGIGLRLGIFEDIRAKSAPDLGIELAIIVGRWN